MIHSQKPPRLHLISAVAFHLFALNAAMAAEPRALDDSDRNWVQVFSASGGEGKKYFELPENARVKFSWETERDGQVPNFRVVLAKGKDRNGKMTYQILNTLVSTQQSGKGGTGQILEKGKYQLYFATKMMKYTFTVSYEKRD